MNHVKNSTSACTPSHIGILPKLAKKLFKKKPMTHKHTANSNRYSSSRWFGKDPYEWQLDITEPIILGLDSVVIAGTGAGKTMPFMMPLLLDKHKKVIIISPLKV